MAARVFVVDDDPQIVRLLKSYLEQAGYEVLAAYDGESALRDIRQQQPDLVILDLMLPDRDGWEITRIIRSDQRLAGLPVVMLTARVDDVDKIVGLELGADDYITKPFNPREVVARVRAVLRRAGTVQDAQPRILKVDGLQMDLDRHEVSVNGRRIDLTPTEFDLLKVLMENPCHAFTRLQLIEQGLGYTYEGLERTVDSHIKNLRKKIEPDPARLSYIQSVSGVGYRSCGGE
jgi:two-component system alkaline phosphatase synthesis response regulator PhoP